ncbi:MAG: amino acid permease, partial [Ktedonobacteraceae bacterium]
WTLGLLTFLVPCAYITQWLGRLFPGAGASYLWASRILGPKWGVFSAFCSWIPSVLVVVLGIQGSLLFLQYLVPAWFVTPLQQCIGIIGILLLVTVITCIPLRWLKYGLLVLALFSLAIYGSLGVAGIWWLWSQHPAAVSLSTPSLWQLNRSNMAIYGLVILAFLGVEVPLLLGGELGGGVAGAKRAMSYVWWGAGLTFAAYIIATFGLLVVVPPDQAGALSSGATALALVFGSLVGKSAVIVLICVQIASAVASLLAHSRLLAIVARDHHLPEALARINRHGIPVFSVLTQAGCVAIVTVLSFWLVPVLFVQIADPASLAVEIYNVLLAGTTTVWVFSTAQMFGFALWHLYRHHRTVQAPGRQRLLVVCLSVLGIGAACASIWTTISFSWIPSLLPDGRWSLLVSVVVVVILCTGWLSTEMPRLSARLTEQQRISKRERALRVQVQEIHAQLQESHREQEILIQQQQELIAEVDRLYQEQAKAAVTDAITGLPNHRAIMNRINEELARCERTQGTCAILFIDLDHFKRINDTWGHRAGDVILHEIATRLRTTLRLEDFVGRYGGEEFALVLADADLLDASLTAERLRVAIAAQPCIWQPEADSSTITIPVTASIGVSTYKLHGVTREKLVEQADHAMYRAKQEGRDQVCVAQLTEEAAQPVISSTAIESSETAHVSTVHALTAAASARDRGTNAHAHRMVALAEETARVLNRSEEEIHLIRLGALLHDIGKIGIPDAILHKPGSLTAEEWAVMRLHPRIGQHILSQAGGVFIALASIVVAHHERWDGQGYPAGLSGEAIPLAARILTVIDSYDAMTSRRVYRTAMSPLAARAELERCAGSQYDPDVVAAFFKVLDTQDIMGAALLPPRTNTSPADIGFREASLDSGAF